MGTTKGTRFYRAAVARRVCGLSQRRLQYWITEAEVLVPSMVWQRNDTDKSTFVFTFVELALLRVIARLRAAGMSLAAIKYAIKEAQRTGLRLDDGLYLVTDGARIYRQTRDPGVVVDLSRKQRGQLVFATLALGPVRQHVERKLKGPQVRPIPQRALGACLRPWAKRVVG